MNTLENPINLIPERFRAWALLLAVAGPYITRAYYALANGRGLRGMMRAVWWGTNTPADGEPVKISSGAKVYGLALAGLLALGLVGGTAGCGKATLEAGGAYAPTNSAVAPDLALYQIDLAFDLADSATRELMKFERDNRALLWKVDPNIKKTFDQWRPKIVVAEQEFALARMGYLANPVPSGLDQMGTILARLQQISGVLKSIALPPPLPPAAPAAP
jgi:hypothetical protein